MALNKEVLEKLLEASANQLLERIESGEYSPADMANALRMLKDNDVTVIVKDSDALSELHDKLAKRRIKKVDLDSILDEGLSRADAMTK